MPGDGSPPRLLGLREVVRYDYEAFLAMDPLRPRDVRRRLDVLTQPGFLSVVVYRVAARIQMFGIRPLARLVMLLNFILFGVELHPGMKAGPGLVVAHPQNVAVGNGVVLGSRVKLHRGVGIGSAGYRDVTKDGMPVVGDDCVLFDGAKVFGPVTVGARSRVGTNVVLFESVPEDSTVVLNQDIEIRTRSRPLATPTGDED